VASELKPISELFEGKSHLQALLRGKKH